MNGSLKSRSLNIEYGITTATLTLTLSLSGRELTPYLLRRLDFRSNPVDIGLKSPKRNETNRMTNMAAIMMQKLAHFIFIPVIKYVLSSIKITEALNPFVT